MEFTDRNIIVCEMSADLFKLACRRGYDSQDFINKLVESEEGRLLYSNKSIDMWLGAEYVMQGIEKEVSIKSGKPIREDVMAWMGYLIKCWSITYPNENLEEILKQAPYEILVQSYSGFHVMSYEDAILNLKEIYNE